MKQRLTKHIWSLIIFSVFTLSSFAQDEINTEFINRMNYVFSPLEKNRVPNGLLLDYAMEFADLKSYNGVITDSNKVNAGLLRDIYSTLTMSAIHTNAGGFYSTDYMDSIWQLQRQPGIITLSGAYYNYARLRDDAISSNLITVSNDQFYDRYVNSVWQNPYQTERVFAMSPSLHAYSGKSFQVVLPSNLWFTNNAASVSSIALNFNDGAGYRTLTIGQAINISYADTGTKAWTFRLTLTDNSTLYSHTEMKIDQEPNAYGASGCNSCRFPRPGGPIFLTADIPFNGQSGQGWITVDYANPADATGRFRLVRPLIVVEGFDPGHLLNPEEQFGETSFETFSRQVARSNSNLINLLQGNLQQYDIIYVDWFRGTDFLQRNALLLERVLRWVNEEKALDGSIEPNVVLGQSMGGVISRWALRDMENRGLNAQTRLFISWDAPQQGANIPVAYQHAARHANNLLIQTAIPTLLGGTNFLRLIRNGLNLMDVPAARQMLYNRALANGQLNNTEHNAWQLELRNLGYPLQSRNVAVSNGSECGIGQGFQQNADLVNLNGRANTRILTDLFGTFTGPGLGFWGGLSLLTLKPQFLLGIVPGRNDLIFEINCKAQPESGAGQIYKGKISYKKKILWLINVNTTITDRSRNADASVLAIDGTPGGMYDTELSLQSSSFQNWAIKYNITASNTPHFNFVPTTSSLDIGSGNVALNLANYQAGYVGEIPPAAPFNTPFDNFTTAFNQVPVSNGTINNNENHIQIAARNGNWLAEELNGNINIRTNCSAFCAATEIAGNFTVCGTRVYNVPLVAGATYNWSVNNPALVTLTPNGNQVTVTRVGNGQVTLSVTIFSDCGIITLNALLNLISVPQIDFVGFTNDVGGEGYWCSTHYNNLFYVEPDLQNVSYEARLLNYPSMTVFRTNSFANPGTDPFGYVPSGWYIFQLRATNTCGASAWYETEIEYVDCFNYGGEQNFSILASPNPTDGELYVTLDKEKPEVKTLSKTERVLYQLYDLNRTSLIKQWTFDNSQNQQRVNVSGIKAGQYILVVTKGKYRQSTQIIIK